MHRWNTEDLAIPAQSKGVKFDPEETMLLLFGFCIFLKLKLLKSTLKKKHVYSHLTSDLISLNIPWLSPRVINSVLCNTLFRGQICSALISISNIKTYICAKCVAVIAKCTIVKYNLLLIFKPSCPTLS